MATATSPASAAQQPSQSSLSFSAPYRAVLDKYCVTCHNQQLRTAGLMLDRMDLGNVSDGAAVWEKVVRKLRRGEMPPAGRPRPDQAVYDAFSSWLETKLDLAAKAHPNPGRPAVHRLNRTEYANVIRDLLGLEVDVESLLAVDDTAYGFDNIADSLGMSPLLLEQYIGAAEKISRFAVGSPAILPVTEIYRPPPDLTQTERFDGLPFGTRGGMLIRHYFPLDGEYTIVAKLGRTVQEYIRGLEENHDVDISLDGVRIKLSRIDGESYKKLASTRLLGVDGIQLAVQPDDDLKVRARVAAGLHVVGVAFIKKTSAAAEDTIRPLLKDVTGGGAGSQPLIASVAISGPFEGVGGTSTATRRRIFVCSPRSPAEELPCATKIISTLARRAYRRPATDADLQVLLSFYEAERKVGTFDAGIEMALRRMLASSQFVFRFERDPAHVAPGAAYRVSDIELASRLSFFLWSSMPDDELLRVASAGRLRNPAVLERQVRRMLADPKSQALVANFAGQWLHLRNLRTAVPDGRLFPDFDDNLRQAFRRETELLFDSVMREDRSVLDLLEADYTFVNERLARHYGIPGVIGPHFRRVPVPDPNRRGLLGQGSILTVTSYGTRTSPVIRGKWILENLLGAPPPPPPPDVPELSVANPDPAKVLTMRERMAQHRANPVCAGCHTRMDPLGFALENFDAVGRWRTIDSGVAINADGALRPSETGAPVDASGALPDGTTFDGPASLRAALLQRPQTFITTMVEKLLTYALGRGLEHYDAPAVRAITREAARRNDRFSSLIMGIVKSVPFQMRASAADPAQSTAMAR